MTVELVVAATAVALWVDDTGTTDTAALLVFVLAAGLGQAIVTYTVCVTVSGRRLMTCVGPAP